jgi:anti-sigma factor RsiW
MPDEVRLNCKGRVKRDMTHQEIRRRLPDYVLGLLAPEQANQILDHMAGCAACRRIVQDEREIGQMVRQTLSVATHPDPARLRQLMPPPPGKIRQVGTGAGWVRSLAPALVVLLLIVGAVMMQSPASRRPLPAIVPATATATTTNTPTATIAQGVAIPAGPLPAAWSDQTSSGPVWPSPANVPTPTATEIYMASN